MAFIAYAVTDMPHALLTVWTIGHSIIDIPQTNFMNRKYTCVTYLQQFIQVCYNYHYPGNNLALTAHRPTNHQ